MKKNAVFVILFFVVLFGFAAATFLLPAKTMSPNENRGLAQAPTLSVNKVLSGDFQSDLDAFLSDQIPGREFWIHTNTALKKALGKAEINGVYLGKDGYYFQAFTQESYSPNRRNQIFALIGNFIKEQTVPVTVMPVPTPSDILYEKLPAHAPVYDAQDAWEAMEKAVGSENFVNLRSPFRNATQPLYYRTDHHWTAHGAYTAYVTYCTAKGITPGNFYLETVSDEFYGTIYSKTLDADTKPDTVQAVLDLPELEVIYDGDKVSHTIYDHSKLSEKDKYAFFFGGNYGTVEINTNVENGKRLLIVKDSFANAMVPYLLGHYQQIVMVDLRYYGGSVSELAENYGSTEILFLYEMTNLLADTGIVKLR